VKKTTAYQATLCSNDIRAIVEGRYLDIFSVLGLHQNVTAKGLVVRALFPHAQQVSLVARSNGRTVAHLKKIDEAGLFEALMSNRKNAFDYFYRVTNEEGIQDIEDTYRFPSLLDERDIYLFGEGTHDNVQNFLGANRRCVNGVEGVLFVVWAPAATRVSLVAEFNGWDGRFNLMRQHPGSGLHELFVPGVSDFALYKYEIIDREGQRLTHKADPYAKSMEHYPHTASRVVTNSHFDWSDQHWLTQRAKATDLQQPVSIYEVHAGSWRRKLDEAGRYLSYPELADQLIPYVLEMGFTHIQLMPINEYPFDGSWGYQPVGMFAPTIRYGRPEELKAFINRCHQHNIGVLLDWVPAHFPTDSHGLGQFDGTCLYEHEDKRKGFHQDWQTLIYNYGRGEVMSYLLSNANYWLSEFHFDGLRVDAVSSMLYLDYSRNEGEWIPNKDGGRENLEAIQMLQNVNTRVYQNHPGILMIAEESTSWPGVSKPVYNNGLGFGYKWNMGWMNDSLSYMKKDPIHRAHHHNEMTFSMVYAWDENFILAISHDEVIHGKGSLLRKMPGDEWQKFANVRAYLGFMWAHPGKKLLFMGCEFAQRDEWNHDIGLQWQDLELPSHKGVQQLVRDLNGVYKEIRALHECDAAAQGFQWLQHSNKEQSIFSWLRRSADGKDAVIVISNMTPQTHHAFQVGVPSAGNYRELINTDAQCYGGSGLENANIVSTGIAWDGQADSVSINLPPLATLILHIEQ